MRDKIPKDAACSYLGELSAKMFELLGGPGEGREYFLITELFTFIHEGSDVCDCDHKDPNAHRCMKHGVLIQFEKDETFCPLCEKEQKQKRNIYDL